MTHLENYMKNDNFYFTWIDGKGDTQHKKIPSSTTPPILYITSDTETDIQCLTTREYVRAIPCKNNNEYKEYIKLYENVANIDIYHRHVSPEYQMLSKLKDKYSKMDEKPKSGQALFWYIDIETFINPGETATESAQKGSKEIILFQIANNKDDEVILISTFKHYKTDDPNIRHILCDTYDDMIEAYIELSNEAKPAITTAHFGDVFDFPYILAKCKQLFPDIKDPAKLFSPHRQSEAHKVVTFSGDVKLSKPIGAPQLDFVEVYKKVTFGSRESWGLDYISKYELGELEGKVPFEELGYSHIGDFCEGVYNPEYDDEENSPRKIAYENGDEHLLHLEWLKIFMDYGAEDVRLLKKLDNKLKALDLIMTMSQTFSCNVYDVFGTVKPWNLLLATEALKRNQVLPAVSVNEDYSIAGGHVFAKPGLHKDVIIEDYTSLYPFVIMDLCMSPETYVSYDDIPSSTLKRVQDKLLDPLMARPFLNSRNKIELYDPGHHPSGMTASDFDELMEKRKTAEVAMKQILEKDGDEILVQLKKHNLTMAPNGTFFRKDPDALVPALVRQIFDSRKADKTEIKRLYKLIDEGASYDELNPTIEVLDVSQMTKKILINSLYGFLTSSYSSLANADLGAAITSYGRFNIKECTNYILSNIKGSECTLQDTDSFHLSLAKLVPKELTDPFERTRWLFDYTTEKISPLINSHTKTIASWFNGLGILEMDFEAIALKEIVTAKKRYACLLYYDDRFLKVPKKKIVGIEIKRSSTPSNVKKALDKLLDLIFEGDNKKVSSFIKAYRKVHPTMDIDKIAMPTSISNFEKYFDAKNKFSPKGATQTAKAAHLHNSLAKSLGLTEIDPIVTGNKMKVVPLKDPILEGHDTMIAFKDWIFLRKAGIRTVRTYGKTDVITDKIDYTTLFDKSFLKPATALLDAIGWVVDTKKQMKENLF